MTSALVLAMALAPGAQAASGPASPPPPAPTVQVDARWSPWVGCWRPDPAGQGDARICLVPTADGSIRWLAVSNGQVTDEETITADGKARPMEDRDCRGTESATWLTRSARLVRTSDLTCGKDARRKVTGLWFLSTGHVWIEAQAVDTEGTRKVRLQRYRLAADQHLPPGVDTVAFARGPEPPASALEWSIDDVIDASKAVPPEALQAAISELNAPFALSGKSLIRMADAGVPTTVIDLVVAVTHPSKFLVRRADDSSPGWATYEDWPGLEESVFDTVRYAGMAFPWFYDPWMGMWGLEDYYWSSCGYGWCGDYYGGGWVDVSPGPPVGGGGGGGGGGATSTHGRVIKGLGYTQVTERPAPQTVSSGAHRGGSGGESSSSSGSSSSGSSASPGGYSGGGGASGGDRTAVPRQ